MNPGPQSREVTMRRLARDVAATLGASHVPLVDQVAENVAGLQMVAVDVKLVEDVQQTVHDTFIDVTWPTCPLHSTHPLWYRDGAWWCTTEQTQVALLGELNGAR